jgi:HD-GYP domain-containing protein (c-di-GMP phosphodiesterase class II)/nitrate/nitrite-specific signal transduction histidine kinase
MTVRKWFNQFNQVIRRSLRIRLCLLSLLSIFPASVLLIYSSITRQHHKGLAVVLIAISVGITILLGRSILNLKSIRSLIELSKRISSGDLAARASQIDSLGVFGELAQSLDRIAASLQARTEKLQHQTEKAEVLSEIVNELAIQHDIATLLQLVVDKVKILLGASFAVINLYDASRSDLEIVAVSGSEVPPRKRIQLGEGAAGRAAETRQPFLVDRYDLWEDRLPEFEPYAFTTVLQVPMVYRDELIGVLGVAEIGSTRKFTEWDLRLMKLIAGTAASAIRNARLFEETHRRLQALEAINTVSSALRVAQNVDEMLPALLEKTMSVVSAIMGSIWLYEPADDTLHQEVSNGIPPLTIRIKPGEQIFGEVFSNAQPYFTFDWREDPLIPNSIRTLIPKGLSGAFIPIRATESTIGVLHVGFHSPHEFPEDQKHLLTAIAEIAGSAIHRAQLYEQTTRQFQRLSAFHQIDLAIIGNLDMSSMLRILLDQVINQLGIDAARVLVVNPSRQSLEFAASRGFRSDALSNTDVHFGTGYVGQIVLDQGTIYIPDLKARYMEYLRSESFEAEEFVSYLAVPLMAKDQPQGVLEIFHRSPLKHHPEWLDFLEALASQAAIMIGYAKLLEDLQRSNTELNLAYDSTLEGWSRALEVRDRETKGHSHRVAEITLRLARAMNVSEQDLVHIYRGALLHDIGKLGIPDNILLKSGPLNEDERELIRKHSTIAFEMLAPISYLRPALDIPHSHHEMWDGNGYPRGLKGEEIPLAARIFAVIDVWDALTSDRPYRKAWSEEAALAYIREQAGKHFDPEVVAAFLSLIDHEKPEYGDIATDSS